MQGGDSVMRRSAKCPTSLVQNCINVCKLLDTYIVKKLLESEAPEITFNPSDSSKLQGDTDNGSKQPINKGEAVQQKAQQKALQNEEKLQLINPESE